MKPPLELRFRHAYGHAIIESDVIICPRTAWSADPRSADNSWSLEAISGLALGNDVEKWREWFDCLPSDATGVTDTSRLS